MSVFCDICNIDVSSESVMQAHIAGKKHNMRLGIVERQRKQAATSVYVTGFPRRSSEKQLSDYFKQYGAVDRVYIDRERARFAIVSFKNMNAVDGILSLTEHWFMGVRISVKPKEMKLNKPKKQEESTMKVKPSSLDHDGLMEILQSCKDLDHQMTVLQSSLELNAQDVRIRSNMVSSLESHFQAFIPGCKLHQFGSSVNGYGVKGSDLDLYLDFNLDQEFDYSIASDNRKQLPYLGDLGKELVIQNGMVTRQSLKTASIKTCIRFVSRLLLDVGRGTCNDIVTICTARCPVIKFLHVPTQLRCDLSINNKLALCNTGWIRMCSESDPRIKPFVYCIRYWAKLKEVAGNENSGPKLTNYALMLLIYYYLQILNPPILPCVQKLANLAEKEVIVEGWNCSYPTNPSCLHLTGNTQNLEELLIGFFKFIETFDFGNKIVCPLSGEPQEIVTMQNCGEHEKTSGFKFSSICIQDPFVLNHNTSGNVNEKVKIRLIDQASQVIAKMTSEKYKKQDGKLWGLGYILSEERLLVEGKRLSQYSTMETLGSLLKPNLDFTVSVELKVAELPADFIDAKPATITLEEFWIQEMCKFAAKLLCDILHCDMVESDVATNLSELESSEEQPELELSEIKISDSKRNSTASCSSPARKRSKNSNVVEPCVTTVETRGMMEEDLEQGEPSTVNSAFDNGEAKNVNISSVESDSSKTDPQALLFSAILNPISASSHRRHQETEINQAKYIDSSASRGNKDSANESLISQDKGKGNGKRVLKVYICSIKQRMWAGRKGLKHQVGIIVDEFLKEEAISSLIAESSTNLDPTITFKLTMSMSKKPTSLTLDFLPDQNEKEFGCFYPFFKSYFNKMVYRMFPLKC